MLLLTALAVSGCATSFFSTGYSIENLEIGTDSGSAKLKKVLEKEANLECCFADRFGEHDSPDAATCAKRRNAAVALLMTQSNIQCTAHLRSIYGNEAAANIATGSIATLASTLAAASTALQAATNWAALATFASAERSLFNETIYKSMLTTAIGTKIREKREEKARNLLLKSPQTYDQYRIEEAMLLVQEYHESCSFFRGLEWALAEGTQNNREAKRVALENRMAALTTQINLYAMAQGVQKPAEFWKNNDPETLKDPVLKDYLARYARMQQEFQVLSDSLVPVPPAKAEDKGAK